MYACKAYYDNGLFVPLGIGNLPNGTRAIITLLDETLRDVGTKLADFDKLCEAARAASHEEMPPFERVNFAREVEI